MNTDANRELLHSLRELDPASVPEPIDEAVSRRTVRERALTRLRQGNDPAPALRSRRLSRWLAVAAAVVALPSAYAIAQSVGGDSGAEVATESGSPAGVDANECPAAAAGFEEAGIASRWQPTVYADGCPSQGRVEELIQIIRRGRDVIGAGGT